MSVAHTHPDIELNWVAEGSVEYLMAGRLGVIRGGELGLFWGGVPHQLLPSTGSVAGRGGVWITLPLRWLLAWSLANDLTARLMSGELVTVPLAGDRARQWLEDYEAGEAHRQVLLLELQALIERVALTLPVRRVRAAKGGRSHGGRVKETGIVEQVVTYLAENYHRELSMEQVAVRVHLHPKYLMGLFRRQSGVSIGAYLLSLRLAHAQRLLATTELGVLEIATSCGFGSLSRFYQAFSQSVGDRPLNFRRRHRQ